MNIIVTGASRGIGRAVVQELSRHGDNTILALARSQAELASLQQEHHGVIPIECDITDEPRMHQTMLNALQELPQVDILIHNAAMLINKPFEQTSSADFLRIFQANLFSIVFLTQLVMPWMENKKLGHIVNISSIGGLQGTQKFAGLSAYCASKAALVNLTECLAVELQERRVHVNCLALGSVQTNMLEQAFPDYKAQFTPETVASFIADFALKGHQVCNGKVIPLSVKTP